MERYGRKAVPLRCKLHTTRDVTSALTLGLQKGQRWVPHANEALSSLQSLGFRSSRIAHNILANVVGTATTALTPETYCKSTGVVFSGQLFPVPDDVNEKRQAVNARRSTPTAAAVTACTEPEPLDPESKSPTARPERKRTPSSTRAETMRLRWTDPLLRARLLQNRRSNGTIAKQAASLSKRWQDPAFRARMRQALSGKPAWNRGKKHSEATREKIRLGMLRHWVKRRGDRAGTEARTNSDTSEENAFDRLKRQFTALAMDLKLWSDGFYTRMGRRPRASDIEAVTLGESQRRSGRGAALDMMTPALMFKCQRFLELKRLVTNQDESLQGLGDEIIQDDLNPRK